MDAVTKGYDKYQMESYVVRELPVVVGMAVKGLGESGKVGILGHSMGGMGALSLAFRNQGLYGSVSAIAPICNPVACPWGRKCYGGYLGEDVELWKKYDPCELVREKGRLYDDILLDQGDADSFLEEQLKPHTFVEACQSVGQKVCVPFLSFLCEIVCVCVCVCV